MLLRFSLLFLALGLLVLSLLTVFRSPAWSPWKWAVLAGEFGHWLALPAIAVVFSAWSTRGGWPMIALTSGTLALTASALFLKPAMQAWRIAQVIPDQLKAHGGGGASPTRRIFSFPDLFFGRDPAVVSVRTLDVGGGLLLDFYPPMRPAGDAGPVPCVVAIHGGGWDSGDRTQLPKLNHWLAGRGYAVAAISYRLAPHALWPAQRDDVHAALAFLRSRAAELGIDPARWVLLGRSAGGQIAQTVGYTLGDPSIRGVVALYAPSDLIFGYVNTHENDMLKSPALMRQFLGGTPESARANYESASAIFHVGPRTPPTLLLHGTNDALAWHRHSERLAARLAEHRVPHTYVALPWATHGFEFNLHGPGGQITTYALERFLTAITARDNLR